MRSRARTLRRKLVVNLTPVAPWDGNVAAAPAEASHALGWAEASILHGDFHSRSEMDSVGKLNEQASTDHLV
jgi:hypothetical protein